MRPSEPQGIEEKSQLTCTHTYLLTICYCYLHSHIIKLILFIYVNIPHSLEHHIIAGSPNSFLFPFPFITEVILSPLTRQIPLPRKSRLICIFEFLPLHPGDFLTSILFEHAPAADGPSNAAHPLRAYLVG